MELDWRPVFPGAELPIFHSAQAGRVLYYTPGWVVTAEAAQAAALEAALNSPGRIDLPLAEELLRRAALARQAWSGLHATRPFRPLCLTLYLNNTCNLNCAYCFADPGGRPSKHLSLEAILAAAELVATNCRAAGRPLTVVFHGGGEPTLDSALILRALDGLEALADRHGLPLFRYLATNGVIEPERAAGLLRRFDLVGLSCDGPAPIQDAQRPLRQPGRRPGSRFVEETAQLVHRAGKELNVRVTITPASLDRQAEIADYLCRTLQPRQIHVEPVYAGGRAGLPGEGFTPEQAEAYVTSFFQAREHARSFGVGWLASGSRPAEIHTAYCHVWREVLNLTPEGLATACFAASTAAEVERRGVRMGAWEAENSRFVIEEDQVLRLQQALAVEPQACRSCFNRYHCVRDCPDGCPLEAAGSLDGFRCRVQARLADRLIRETADRLGTAGEFVGGPVR